MDGWMHTEEKKKKELLECSELVLPLLSHGFLFLCLSPTCILPGCSRNLDSNMRWKVSVVNAIGAYPDPLLASTPRCQLLWVLADNNSPLSFSLKIFPQPNGKHLDQEPLPTTLPPQGLTSANHQLAIDGPTQGYKRQLSCLKVGPTL